MRLSFHSVAVFLTLVRSKQIINIHKRKNTKHRTDYKNIVNTSTRITKISTQLSKTPTHYKTVTTATVQDTHQMN